ncbi:MAG: response regulator, PilZ [Deltaproteobacteria bacterium]|nr:response regulator, PilZ [Deltaproteobacteria bacterium]
MKKVLLASASKVFLKRNTNLLKGRGFQLISTMNGAEALKLHKEYLFDLVLADLKLEDMCGCTLLSLVREEEASRHVPVILICHKISGSIERVEQSGASAMLLKPIDPIQLIETIGSFLDMQIGRSKRVVLNVKVLVKKIDLEFYCLSYDISNTGILLETEYNLDLGVRIMCRFTLPGSCKIEAEGEVIRYMSTLEYKSLYGVKFINLPLPYLKSIEHYLAATANSCASTQNLAVTDLFA